MRFSALFVCLWASPVMPESGIRSAVAQEIQAGNPGVELEIRNPDAITGTPPFQGGFGIETQGGSLAEGPFDSTLAPLQALLQLRWKSETSIEQFSPVMLDYTLWATDFTGHLTAIGQSEIQQALLACRLDEMELLRDAKPGEITAIENLPFASVELQDSEAEETESDHATTGDDSGVGKEIAVLYARRGRIFYGLGLFDLALADYETAMKWHKDETVRKWMAVCLWQMHRFEDTLKVIENLQPEMQSEFEIRMVSASSRLGLGQPDAATEILKDLAASNSLEERWRDETLKQVETGTVARQRSSSQSDDMLVSFHRAVEDALKHRDNADVMLRLCELCSSPDLFARFMATREVPENGTVNTLEELKAYQRFPVVLHSGQLRLMLEAATRLNLLGNSKGHRFRARGLVAVGLTRFALDDIRIVIGTEGATPEDWRIYSVALLASEKAEEGLQAANRAVALFPDDAATLANLGWVLGNLGKHRKAIEVYTGLLDRPVADGPEERYFRIQIFQQRSAEWSRLADYQELDDEEDFQGKAIEDLRSALQLVDDGDTTTRQQLESLINYLEQGALPMPVLPPGIEFDDDGR